MYHWIVNMRLQAILECFVDDVIRSQNKSKLWTTIALSTFEPEKRSKAHNVANWTGYQKFKFQFHIQISKFWQVRNLRLPFHFLSIKYHNLKHAPHTVKQRKLEQLERLRFEIPATAPWLPILVIHIRSQVKTRQNQSYKVKKKCQKFKCRNFARNFTRDTPSEVAW